MQPLYLSTAFIRGTLTAPRWLRHGYLLRKPARAFPRGRHRGLETETGDWCTSASGRKRSGVKALPAPGTGGGLGSGANLLPTAAAGARQGEGPGEQGGKYLEAGRCVPGGAGLVARRALSAWPRPRRAPAALYGAQSRPQPPPASPGPCPPATAALGRAGITAIQLELLGSTMQGAAIPPALCPPHRGTRVRAGDEHHLSLVRPSGTPVCSHGSGDSEDFRQLCSALCSSPRVTHSPLNPFDWRPVLQHQ